MNKVFLIGRLTKSIELKYSQAAEPIAIAAFSLAVDGIKKDEVDFINCKAFGKTADTLDKYTTKGTKIAIEGRIKTGSYEKDGKKVYTTDVIVERFDFCESKGETKTEAKTDDNGFMAIPDSIEEELPFM